jgi:hypothetical protein
MLVVPLDDTLPQGSSRPWGVVPALLAANPKWLYADVL